MSKKIYLKKGRESSLLRFHPWVFSGAVSQIIGEPEEGDLVGVFASTGDFLAYGHYQIGSIAVRILSFDSSAAGADFYKERLGAALGLRNGSSLLRGSETNCYRLVHGEGDFLPGLVVDVYGNVAVMQCHSAGMFRAKKQIADALVHVYEEAGQPLQAIYDKSSGTAPFKAGLELVDGYVYGSCPCDVVDVKENGISYKVDFGHGQKTGFFLDQRDNRKMVRDLSEGRNVLNLFCYTGGFSLSALKGGAREVVSVDSSSIAIDSLEENLKLNQDLDASRHKSCCTDAIEYLKNVEAGKYDLMIVDPPAFAKHRGALNNALRAYQRLNAAAISKVASGGFIFTFSCSQVVSREDFALVVFSAAASCGRKVRILRRLGHPADHPVSIYHPEGEYLKGLLLYVE